MMSGPSRSCSRQREVIGVNITRAQLPETPYYSNQKLRKKILADMYIKEGVIEGTLEADKTTGWVHKKWDSKAIRLNLDTRMIKVEVPAQYPIPTLEQLRHRLLWSNRYSIVDLNDKFHQFPLDESKE